MSLAQEGVAVRLSSALKDGNLRMLPAIYAFMTRYTPKLYGGYFALRRTAVFGALNAVATRRLLRSTVARLPADLDQVVIMQGVYCNALDGIAATSRRVTVVATDLFGGVPEWFRPGAHRYIVASELMARTAIESGVDPERVLLRRMPALAVSADRTAAPAVMAPIRRVLVVGGKTGAGPIMPAVSGLVGLNRGLAIEVVCGTNHALKARLERQFGSEVGCHAVVPELYRRYRDFDLVITKPGTATLMELVTMRVPFFIIRGIPGIEGRNAQIVGKLIGMPPARSARDIQNLMRELLDHDGTLTASGRAWLANLEALREMLPDRAISWADLA